MEQPRKKTPQEVKKKSQKISTILNIKKPLKIASKPRHHSFSLNSQQVDIAPIFEFIEQLLGNVDKQYTQKDKFVSNVLNTTKHFDSLGQTIFDLNENQSEEILNFCQEQPQPQNVKHLNVVPSGHIKSIGLVKVPAYRGTIPEIPPQQQTVEYKQQQKQRRQTIITKLKKQYMKTLNTKYIAQNIPLVENRSHFIQNQSQEVAQIRKTMSKRQMLLKKPQKGNKHWHNDSPKRKQQKLLTVHKKNREYIDRIDPTNESFMKTNFSKQQIKHQRRGSLFFFTDQFQLPGINTEENVTAKITNFSSISLTNKVSKEKTVGHSDFRTTKQNVKLPSLGLDREQLSKKVQSMHINTGVRMKTLDTEHKLKVKNSLSASSSTHLPSLHHHR